MDEPREAKTAPLLSGPLYMFLVPLIHKLLKFSQWAWKAGLLPLRKMFFERKRSRTKLSGEYGPWVKKDVKPEPKNGFGSLLSFQTNKKRQVLLETLNESYNGRCSLNSWSRRESMVRVDESRENGGQWSWRGLNPQLLSRTASVSNGKTKSTCSSRKTFKLY